MDREEGCVYVGVCVGGEDVGGLVGGEELGGWVGGWVGTYPGELVLSESAEEVGLVLYSVGRPHETHWALP